MIEQTDAALIESIKRVNKNGYLNVNIGDADGVGLTLTNNAIAAGLLTHLTQEIVNVITRKRTAEIVVGQVKKVLSWDQNDLAQPILEHLGDVAKYSDYGNPPATSLNPTFAYTGHERLSTTVRVGDLEAKQMANAHIDAHSQKIFAAMEALAIKLNDIAFKGAGKPTNSVYPVYGILNHPDLPAYKQLNNLGITGTMSFDNIYGSIQDMVQEIISASKGHIGMDADFYLCVPNSLAKIMTVLNNFGMSLRQILKDNYPNMKIEMIPEFVNAYNDTNDVMYLRAENKDMANVSPTAIIGISQVAMASAVEQHPNFTEQVFSSGTAGVILYKPYLFSRRYITA